jgi:hypothetical protein
VVVVVSVVEDVVLAAEAAFSSMVTRLLVSMVMRFTVSTSSSDWFAERTLWIKLGLSCMILALWAARRTLYVASSESESESLSEPTILETRLTESSMALNRAERLVDVTEEELEVEVEVEDELDVEVVVEVDDVLVLSSVESVELVVELLTVLKSNDELSTLLIVLDMISLLRKIKTCPPA